MTTQLATVDRGDLDRANSFIQQLGGPAERQYMMEVMAATLGIPENHADRPDVVALMGKAIEKTVRLGWIAGTHMHVVPYTSKKTGKTTYTLIDGEKGWWDSAARWREKGEKWYMDRSLKMDMREVAAQAKSTGLDKNVSANAAGCFSRVIIESEIDLMIKMGQKPDEVIPWSVGLYTGFKKVGFNWFDDGLPTGTSPSQVAQRRADKLAIMASSLTLIPLDDGTESARLKSLANTIHRQAEQKRKDDTYIVQRDQLLEEVDGLLLATPQKAAKREKPTVEYDEFETVEDSDEYADLGVELGDGSEIEQKVISINEFGSSQYAEKWEAQKAELLKKHKAKKLSDIKPETLDKIHGFLVQRAAAA